MPACEHARPDALSRWALRHPRLLTTGVPLAVFAVVSLLPLWIAWHSTPSTGLVPTQTHFWAAVRSAVDLFELNGWSFIFRVYSVQLLGGAGVLAIPTLCAHAQLHYARQTVRYGNLRRRHYTAK
jgi:hypothetical protein